MIPDVKIDMSEETIKYIGTKFFEIINEYELSISEIKVVMDKILNRMEELAIIPSK